MYSIEHLNTKLKILVEFLTPLLPIANSHLVEFIIQDQWNNLLPSNLKDDLNNLHQSKLNLIPTAELHGVQAEPSEEPVLSLSLEDFLIKVRSLHADSLNILTSLHQLQNLMVDEEKQKLLNLAMSSKKAYEVSYMSQIVANICKENKIEWIIDVGSGLGYLSSVLLIQHNLNVFTLDSSSSNILSTLKRSKIIKNLWKHLDDKRVNKEKLQEKQVAGKEGKEEDELLEDKDNFISFNAFQGRFIGLTKFITDKENICDLVSSNIKRKEDSNSQINFVHLGLVGLHTCGNLAPTSLKLFIFNPNIKFVCNVGCCYQLLEEEFITDSFHVNKHLTSDTESNCVEDSTLPDNRYHCLELDPLHRRESGNTGYGFPLSSYLKSIKFSLGRNARDLASKSMHRISTADKNLESLFWRALLEVIVTDIHGSWPQNASVGRKTSKTCKQFDEYCRKSLENIGLDSKLTDEQISAYYDKHRRDEDKLIKFYFLKVALAPVIENLINLDRLIFLHEQGLENSHLVQIFDGAVSPRSTAIISFK